MMKKLATILAVLFLGTFLVVGSAMAVPFKDGGAALQGVLDDITIGPVNGDSSVDVTTDYLDDDVDSYWSITATGGSVSTLIIELASFAPNNNFGVYDATNAANKVEIFQGAATAGAQATLSIYASGEVLLNGVSTGVTFSGNKFGYFLDSSYYGNGGVWHSDTALNNDNLDHMAAYQGKGIDTVQILPFAAGLWDTNEYILAFEDLKASVSDNDYTDFVVMVESVNPVPEPATMLLLGTSLLGLVAVGRRKMFRK